MNFHDGVIHTKRIKQVIAFDDLRWGNIHPTDIDGCIEYKDKAVILLEYKLQGYEMPLGQRLCLERLAHDIELAGKQAVVLLCEHTTYDTNEPVQAGASHVKALYFKGKWTNGDGQNAKQYVERFINYVKENKQ